MCGTPVKGSMSSRPYHGLPRAADMAVCFGRSCKEKCRLRWLRRSRSPICMHWEIPCGQPTCRQSRERVMVPDHIGRFALISETREEKIGRISGMGPIKWRLLNKSKEMPAAASVRELKSSNHGGKGRSSGRQGMITRSHGTGRESDRTGRSTPSRRCSINLALTTRCFPTSQQITLPGNVPGRRAWRGVKECCPLRHRGLYRSRAQMLCLCLLLGSRKQPRREISKKM